MPPLIQSWPVELYFGIPLHPVKRGGFCQKCMAGKWKYIEVIMDYKPKDYTAFS